MPMHKGTAGKWGRVGTLADVVRTRVASVCRLARVATTYDEQLLAHKWFERIRAASKMLPKEAAKATKAADAERQRQADNIRERLWDKSNRGKDCPDELEEPPPRDDNDDEQPWQQTDCQEMPQEFREELLQAHRKMEDALPPITHFAHWDAEGVMPKGMASLEPPKEAGPRWPTSKAVSYTHLTLPTKRIV